MADDTKLTIEEECERLRVMGIECDVCNEVAEQQERKFKSYKKWLIWVSSTFAGIVVLYLILHMFSPGAENAMLSQDDLTVISGILDAEQEVLAKNQNQNTNASVDSLGTSASNQSSANSSEVSVPHRTLILEYIFRQYPPQEGSVGSVSAPFLTHGSSPANLQYEIEVMVIDSTGVDSAGSNVTIIDTVASNLDTGASKVSTAITEINESRADNVSYITTKNQTVVDMVWLLDSADLMSTLPKVPIATASYFWLDGSYRYWEVIFWSIFGVLCSLLYSGTEYIRKGQFRLKEIYVQIAKLIYTPICALIIIAAYDYFTFDEEANTISKYTSTTGLIVIAFILGFFSGSTIALLQRLKVLLFPSTEKDVEDTADDDQDNIDESSIEEIVNVAKQAEKTLSDYYAGASDETGDEVSANGAGTSATDEVIDNGIATEDQQNQQQDGGETGNGIVASTSQGQETVINDPDETGYEAPETNPDNPEDNQGAASNDPDETGYEPPEEDTEKPAVG